MTRGDPGRKRPIRVTVMPAARAACRKAVRSGRAAPPAAVRNRRRRSGRWAASPGRPPGPAPIAAPVRPRSRPPGRPARQRWPRSCTSPSDTSIARRGDAADRQTETRLRQAVAVQQVAGRIGQLPTRHRQPQRAVADRAGDPDPVAGTRAGRGAPPPQARRARSRSATGRPARASRWCRRPADGCRTSPGPAPGRRRSGRTMRPACRGAPRRSADSPAAPPPWPPDPTGSPAAACAPTRSGGSSGRKCTVPPSHRPSAPARAPAAAR